ncbi:MAG: ornithine cyclodeaminase family protein [Anaerolineales bacterium]|nr:ornithine cyclodeaminase family protein [Anaerolineales bacterium]
MPVPKQILYLTEADVQQTLNIAEAVDLAEKGIKADGLGNVKGDKFYMDVGDAGFVKPFSGYLLGEEFAFVKTFSYFPKNPETFSRPTTSSMVVLLDAETGLPVCLMEASWVTGLKTAASTAVTAAYLARPESETVTIFGAGTLGRLHLLALAERFNLKKAYFVDILPEVAETCAAELEPILGFPVEAVRLEDREGVVRKSDILFTVTTGNQALFEHSWLKAGAFVARLGSYQEIDHDVITKADKVIMDRWKYVSPRIPEIVSLVESGKLTKDDVYAEWPNIIAGKVPGRESPDEIIVFIALGIWGEYAAILPEVYRKAKALGLGQGLPCSH